MQSMHQAFYIMGGPLQAHVPWSRHVHVSHLRNTSLALGSLPFRSPTIDLTVVISLRSVLMGPSQGSFWPSQTIKSPLWWRFDPCEDLGTSQMTKNTHENTTVLDDTGLFGWGHPQIIDFSRKSSKKWLSGGYPPQISRKRGPDPPKSTISSLFIDFSMKTLKKWLFWTFSARSVGKNGVLFEALLTPPDTDL